MTVDDNSGNDESDEESISSSGDELIDLRDLDDDDGWKQHIHLLMNQLVVLHLWTNTYIY